MAHIAGADHFDHRPSKARPARGGTRREDQGAV